MNPISDAAIKKRIESALAFDASSNESDSSFLQVLQARMDEDDEEPQRATMLHIEHHAKSYFSALHPIFLTQLEDVDELEFFSPLLARDGLLSLLHFFHRMEAGARVPRESDNRTLLLVNHRFRDFVPESWESRVAFYETALSVERLSRLRPPKDIYFVLTALDDRQCAPEFLRKRVDELKASLGDRLAGCGLNVVGVWNKVPARDPIAREARGDCYSRGMIALQNLLGPGLQHVSVEKLLEKQIQDAVFVDLNEFDFYYSESFVIHQLLSNGAVPFHPAPPARNFDLWAGASLNHGYRIYLPGSLPRSVSAGAAIGNGLKFLESDLYREEERQFFSNPNAPYDNGLKFCPLSFETLVHGLARKLKI